MALIPPDAAIRLRLQAEANLSAVAPLKELSANLPDLRPGQTFTARIQQVLPENGYRALVDGKDIMLSLPEAVNAGDVVELVVVDRTSRMLLAQLANPLTQSPASQVEAGTEENNSLGKTTQLSPAGQLIGKLLLPAGQEPQPVTLNKGEPLLSSPLPAAADIAAALAPRLEQAATQSGLFYESHQALWLSGQHTTEALLEEPQARHAQDAKLLMAHENAKAPAIPDRGDVATNLSRAGGEEVLALSSSKDLMQSIPAELRPLVQQQLDTAATQRVAWQGEVWPGQTMQWQISREPTEDRRGGGSPDQPQQWNTSLALTSPKLGRVEAALGISGNTVRITLGADSALSVSKLNARLDKLRTALEAAGLKPIGLQVQDGSAGS